MESFHCIKPRSAPAPEFRTKLQNLKSEMHHSPRFHIRLEFNGMVHRYTPLGLRRLRSSLAPPFSTSRPRRQKDRPTDVPPFRLVTAKPCQTPRAVPIQSRHVRQCQNGSAPSGLRRAPAVERFSRGLPLNRGPLTRPIGVPIPWFVNPRSLAKLETRGMIQDVRKFTPYISGHFMSLKDFVERSVRYNPRIIPMRHSETQNSMRGIPCTCENANARHAASQTYSMPRYMTR